jgi:GT2 family glycosyltransferase
MDVSVIIVNYNTRDLAIQCIESVIKYTESVEYELIFIDNASTDDSVNAVHRRFPEVKIIANTENIGFGKANNQGYKVSSGDYIFLLNSDAFLIENAISYFISFMKKKGNEQVAVCGASLISGTERKIASYGNFPSLTESFFSIGLHLLFKKYFTNHLATCVINKDNNIKEVDYISGADMFIRRSAINETGFFDGDFFLYYEETEFSYRLKQKGFTSVMLPAIQIVHLEGASHTPREVFNYRKFEIITRSRNLFFRKCYGKIACILSQLLYVVEIFLLTITFRQKGSFLRKAKIILFA